MICNRFDTLKKHKYLQYEKQVCSKCRAVTYHYCSVEVEINEETIENLCLSCFNKLKLTGVNKDETHDRETMIKIIQ